MVLIDESVVDEYLAFTGQEDLDPKRFQVVHLDHSPIASRIHEHENRPLKGRSGD